MNIGQVTVVAMLAIAASAAQAQESSRAVNAKRARIELPLETRANGNGRVTVEGSTNDGKFSVAEVRIAANRDVVITFDGPTEGRIVGTARNIGERRIQVEVRQFLETKANGSMTVTMRNERDIEDIQGSGKVGKEPWSFEFRRIHESAGTVEDINTPNRIVINIHERGEGSITLDEKPQMDVAAAAVLLQKDGDGEIRLDGRETVHIFGRWREGDNRMLVFDVSRIEEQPASGRIVVNREGPSHIAFDGELRAAKGVYRVMFKSTQ